MITTILACLAGGTIVLAAIVAMVAKAISPLDRGDLSLEDAFSGPPEAAPAFFEMQRLELQFALAEELGGLDAGSLETLRQEIVAARTHYETVLARSTQAVDVLTPQEQLDAQAAGSDCLTPQEALDAAAAVSDCLSPKPAMQPVPVMGLHSRN